MANTFISLPAPAANGAGAWVDASAMGASRTVTVVGNGGVFEPFVTIECSNEDAPGAGDVGYPLITFTMPDEQTFPVACMWMRAVVSNYKGGGAPTVSVGSDGTSTTNVELVATAGNGTGAAVVTSSEPLFKTVQVKGAFRGALNILVSEDGGTTYSQALSFSNPGAQNIEIAADHMKVQRNGVPLIDPGLPEIWIASTSTGGGGGGGGALTVTDETTTVANVTTITADPASRMFVADLGSDNAEIGFLGLVVEDDSATVDGALALKFPGATVTNDTDPTFNVQRAIIDFSSALPKTARYTANGTETDDFQITFASLSPPITVANASYNVFINGGGMVDQLTFDVVVNDNTTAHFHVVASAAPADGDILQILIVPFTVA